MGQTMAKYKRILLKLSGEALKSKTDIYDLAFIDRVAQQIKRCADEGVQIGVIVGAGNIWRGRQGTDMDRCRADHMGMLATVINSLALQDAFLRAGMDAVVMTSVEMNTFAEQYTTRGAIAALEAGKIVVFGGGTGSPYFSTDTAAALRAAEIGADCILMAKNVDGIYDMDPNQYPDLAKRYDSLSYQEIINQKLKAVDLSSAIFCMENNINGYAFGLADPENIYRAVMGEAVGTEIHC